MTMLFSCYNNHSVVSQSKEEVKCMIRMIYMNVYLLND